MGGDGQGTPRRSCVFETRFPGEQESLDPDVTERSKPNRGERRAFGGWPDGPGLVVARHTSKCGERLSPKSVKIVRPCDGWPVRMWRGSHRRTETHAVSALLEEFTVYLGAPRVPSQPFDPEAVSRLLSLATPTAADIGQVLTRQFAPARTLDLLVVGEVRFQIRLEEGNEDLDVGTSAAPWTPIGWSGFRSPGRYATTVVCVSPCRVLRFTHAALDEFFAEYPEVGAVFLKAVLGGSLDLLATISDRIAAAASAPADFAHTLHAEGEEEAYNRAPPVARLAPPVGLFRGVR